MKTLTSLAVLLLLSSSVLADNKSTEKNGIARVMLASGSTTYSGKKISENDVLTTVGVLRTGAEGGAKLKLSGNEVTLEVAANSEINLIIPPSGDPSESIELVHGKVRVRVPKAKNPNAEEAKADKPRFLLRHKKVTMGVRGTDFLAIATTDLGETELVVFTGEVEFANEVNPSETQRVKAGYWSAVGGRFGEKIHNPIKFAKSGLDHFDALSKDTPAFNLQAVPTEKAPEAGQIATPAH